MVHWLIKNFLGIYASFTNFQNSKMISVYVFFAIWNTLKTHIYPLNHEKISHASAWEINILIQKHVGMCSIHVSMQERLRTIRE